MKKIIALVVVMCMVLSLGVFASSDAEGLEKAIMKVKTVTEIPDWLDEFGYSVTKENGDTVWHLSWNDKNYELGRLSASVDQNGNLLSFYRYNYAVENSGEPIDIADAIETAKLYAATVLGNDYAKMQIVNEDTIPIDSTGDYFNIRFGRFENGIPIRNQQCTLGINKYTGVFDTYTGFKFDRITEFVMPEKILSRDEAIAKFNEKIGLKLRYNKYRNYKDNTTTVFPVYCNDEMYHAINAVTGEKVYVTTDHDLYFATSDMARAGSAGYGGANLSPQEQAAVNELGNLISAKDAAAIIERDVEGFEGQKVDSSYISKRYDGRYVMSLDYSEENDFYGYATLDAESGEILYFYLSAESFEKPEKDLDETTRNDMVEGLVRRLAGDRFDEMKHNGKNGYTYLRQVNGIDFIGDGVDVGYNGVYGIIERYSINWTDVEEFPDISDVMTAEETAAKVADNIGFDLCYINGTLCYDFGDKTTDIFSPYTGKQLSGDGSEMKKKNTYKYYDVSGHWCENMLKKLSENQIGLDVDLFCPDDKISLRDFVKLVYHNHYFENDDEIAEYLENLEIFDEINLESQVTRYQAAKVYASILGLSEIAEKAEIFVQPFIDCDGEYNGYVAVCKSFGILSGDGNGNFRGNDAMTRAETAAIIYKFMCR